MNSSPDCFWVKRHQALVLVIDVQEKLVPAIKRSLAEPVVRATNLLLRGAEILQLPVMVTEQYPQGLGHTLKELALPPSAKIVAKTSFGGCGDSSFGNQLKIFNRKQVVVAGMEAHVCVYQTVLGLLEEGYDVHLVRDAVASRRDDDLMTGLENAVRAGAILTSAETVLFQILKTSTASEFKAISALIKTRG